MNTKYIDIIFAMIVFALPFNYIPRMLWQNFFGGPFGSGLVIYPLIYWSCLYRVLSMEI